METEMEIIYVDIDKYQNNVLLLEDMRKWPSPLTKTLVCLYRDSKTVRLSPREAIGETYRDVTDNFRFKAVASVAYQLLIGEQVYMLELIDQFASQHATTDPALIRDLFYLSPHAIKIDFRQDLVSEPVTFHLSALPNPNSHFVVVDDAVFKHVVTSGMNPLYWQSARVVSFLLHNLPVAITAVVVYLLFMPVARV